MHLLCPSWSANNHSYLAKIVAKDMHLLVHGFLRLHMAMTSYASLHVVKR